MKKRRLRREDETGSDLEYFVRDAQGWTNLNWYEKAHGVPFDGYYGTPPGSSGLHPIDIMDDATAEEVKQQLNIVVQTREDLGKRSGPKWFAIRMNKDGQYPSRRTGVWDESRTRAILRAAVQY